MKNQLEQLERLKARAASYIASADQAATDISSWIDCGLEWLQVVRSSSAALAVIVGQLDSVMAEVKRIEEAGGEEWRNN